MTKKTVDIKCNELELIELKYLYALGFKYIARHEKGIVVAFKEKPVRDIPHTAAYGTWVIDSYPIKDMSLYGDIKLGKYDFVKWKDEPVEIKDLLEMMQPQLSPTQQSALELAEKYCGLKRYKNTIYWVGAKINMANIQQADWASYPVNVECVGSHSVNALVRMGKLKKVNHDLVQLIE